MSLAGLSLRDLEYLVAVAENLHFGRAARSCAVSQPALSAQIRKLEAFLGLTVFERIPGRVMVTERGVGVIEGAHTVLTAARMLLDAAREHQEPLAGPFHLGVIPTLGPYLLPLALRSQRDAFPAMQVMISEGRTADIEQQLRLGTLDALLACLPQDDPAFQSHPLFYEPFLLMHPTDHEPTWPLCPLDHGLMLLEEGHCMRDQVNGHCSVFPPGARRHAAGLEMLRHMVAAGEGLSLVPALAARTLGSMDGLVAYTPVADAAVGRQVALVARRTDPRTGHLAKLAALLRKIVPPPAQPLAA